MEDQARINTSLSTMMSRMSVTAQDRMSMMWMIT
jgi:hypothetical protein